MMDIKHRPYDREACVGWIGLRGDGMGNRGIADVMMWRGNNGECLEIEPGRGASGLVRKTYLSTWFCFSGFGSHDCSRGTVCTRGRGDCDSGCLHVQWKEGGWMVSA